MEHEHDPPRRAVDSFEDTEEVPIPSQARAIVMHAAKLRLRAKDAVGESRDRLLREADDLEADALRMAFEA